MKKIILFTIVALAIIATAFWNVKVSALITITTVLLMISKTLIINVKSKQKGTLSKDEVRFIKSNKLDTDDYILNKSKTFNELNLAQRMNDSLYLQKSLNIRTKIQSEIAMASNILEETSGIVLPIDEEVREKNREYVVIYKEFAKKLKGRTITEKVLNSNGIKFKSYFSRTPFLITAILTLLSSIFLTTMPVVTAILGATTFIGFAISLKERKKLNKKQKESLKELVFNLTSTIESMNDEIIGFVRRNKQVLDKVTDKTVNKYNELINIVKTQ